MNIMELIIGINRIKQAVNESSNSLVEPNLVYVYIKATEMEKSAINSTLIFLRNVDANMYLTFEEKDGTMKIGFSSSKIRDFIELFTQLYPTKLFDGRNTLKTIDTKDHTEANKAIKVILALCKAKFYGGYSYDYSTYQINVF